MEIDAQKSKALVMLVAGRRVEDIASEIGVTTRTIHNWKKDKEFQKQYKSALNQVLDGAIAELALYSQQAVRELVDIIDDKDLPKRVKISAISCLLTNLNRLKEGKCTTKAEAVIEVKKRGLGDDTAALIRAKILGIDVDDSEE